MLKTLKSLLHSDSVEDLEKQLSETREGLQAARDVLAMAIDAPEIAQAEADMDRLSKELLRLEARKDLLRRQAIAATAKAKADTKQKLDDASDVAIAELQAYAAEHVEPMLALVETVIKGFMDRRASVLIAAAAAANGAAVRQGQDASNVLHFFTQRALRPLTGVKSSADPTHGRVFLSYLPELKGEQP